MPQKKKKAEQKSKPKEAEKIIEAEIIEEKPPETKIVKVMPDSTELMNLSDTFAKSGMFPAITNKYEAAAVIEYGRELGIKPIISLQTISVIKGRLSIESKALYALALEKGMRVKIIRKDDKGCTLEFSKKGRDSYTTSFTSEDAKRAGLHTKDSYMKYPEEMYFNRCISKGLRAFDPGIFLGVYTSEEMEDFSESPLAKAPVKEEPVKPEEEKKPQVTFTKSKDQPASEPPAEPAAEPSPESKEEEKPPEPPESDEQLKEKQTVVGNIKARLKAAGVDERLYKKWMAEEFQPIKPDRKWVGMIFGNYSFNDGSLGDLKLLDDDENMDWTIQGYLKSETFKEELKKEEPDEEPDEEKIPF